MAALRSPREIDSLNTPKMLNTPLISSKDDLLCTPTLTTPRTADWGLFSPVKLSSSSSSPGMGDRGDIRDREHPTDLPLDSSIGLSSPHDGVLAKRRKLKQQNSGHSRSVESDSNSCDTPDSNLPKDLTINHRRDEHRGDTLTSRLHRREEPRQSDSQPDVSTPTDLSLDKRPYRRDFSPGLLSPRDHLDSVRDRVGAVAISSSPKWFKQPRTLPEALKLKEVVEMPSAYHPSPLAVPSPNWTAISAFMTSEGLALKTPKVLDNFVFDVLPPNTPNTPKLREKSPEPPASMYDRLAFERRALEERRLEEQRRLEERRLEERRLEERRLEERRLEERRLEERRHHHSRLPPDGRTVTFANQVTTRSVSLTPPPPYPEDLSVRHKSSMEEEEDQQEEEEEEKRIVVPKREIMEECTRADSASPLLNGEVKEEPRDYHGLPPGFPPYYLHPGITPHHIYGRQHSPPASPPRLHPFYPPHHRQFYNSAASFPTARGPAMLYESHAPAPAAPSLHPGYMWPAHHPQEAGHHHHHQAGHAPWSLHESGGHHHNHAGGGYLKAPPTAAAVSLLPLKSEGGRLSTDSPDTVKKKCGRRPAKQLQQQEDDEDSGREGAGGPEGQPPKKRGKGKGKAVSKDATGPKRVFICPHCQRSYDWNYNLNRHLKYECGKENAFMCSKCGRRFPHKQNCVYHLKRKHKIVCDTVEQYVSSGLVVYQGGDRGGGVHTGGGGMTPLKSEHSPLGGSCGGRESSAAAYSPDMDCLSPTPSQQSN